VTQEIKRKILHDRLFSCFLLVEGFQFFLDNKNCRKGSRSQCEIVAPRPGEPAKFHCKNCTRKESLGNFVCFASEWLKYIKFRVRKAFQYYFKEFSLKIKFQRKIKNFYFFWKFGRSRSQFLQDCERLRHPINPLNCG